MTSATKNRTHCGRANTTGSVPRRLKASRKGWDRISADFKEKIRLSVVNRKRNSLSLEELRPTPVSTRDSKICKQRNYVAVRCTWWRPWLRIVQKSKKTRLKRAAWVKRISSVICISNNSQRSQSRLGFGLSYLCSFTRRHEAVCYAWKTITNNASEHWFS